MKVRALVPFRYLEEVEFDVKDGISRSAAKNIAISIAIEKFTKENHDLAISDIANMMAPNMLNEIRVQKVT